MMNIIKTTYRNIKLKKIGKFILLFIVVTILIITGKYFNLPEVLRNTLIWIESLGFWGPITFIIIYNLATLLLIPGSVLTLGGGVIFGVFRGSIYVFLASTLGATIAFIIGRYISRYRVSQQLSKNLKFNAINQAVVKEGLKIVFLTRLCPLFPFNLLNYAFGVMQVSLKDYIFGSLGMIPGTFMYVYLGSLMGDIALIDTSQQPTNFTIEVTKWMINIVGLLATVLVTIYLTRLAKKALEESIN
uniref:TVP38/TMEM64 family protein n=1 Tax=Okeania sp. SIO2F4 TaxID=2607790 RepID=UPI0025F3FAB2|nr:TVP38/TMEM64 family protein [Okeania sp. SIO2F4]